MRRKRRIKKATEYSRKCYRSRRDALILFLGGMCCSCGSTVKLTFDHISGDRDWVPNQVHSTKRMRLYLQEAEQGKLQLLCNACNAAKLDSPEEDDFF